MIYTLRTQRNFARETPPTDYSLRSTSHVTSCQLTRLLFGNTMALWPARHHSHLSPILRLSIELFRPFIFCAFNTTNLISACLLMLHLFNLSSFPYNLSSLIVLHHTYYISMYILPVVQINS